MTTKRKPTKKETAEAPQAPEVAEAPAAETAEAPAAETRADVLPGGGIKQPEGHTWYPYAEAYRAGAPMLHSTAPKREPAADDE